MSYLEAFIYFLIEKDKNFTEVTEEK